MARPRKYTAKSLQKAVNAYFLSISRRVPVTERVDSGRKDEMGHVVWEDVPVLNQLGEQIIREEYVIPPTVAGLCAWLGIHRSTWTDWCDTERFPEFADTTTRARGRLQGWNEEQLLTREGKNLKGVIFNLQNNYGYSEHQEVNLRTGSVEEYIRKLEESGEGGAEF